MTNFNWNNFKDVADELTEFNDEAHIRSAIGRYYYASYCSARFYLVNLGITRFLGFDGSHKKLYLNFQNSSDDTEKRLGELLEHLFNRRVEADYLLEKNGNKLDYDYFRNKLSDVKSISDKSLLLINSLINNPPKHRFVF